jgi:hypothetical protein
MDVKVVEDEEKMKLKQKLIIEFAQKSSVSNEVKFTDLASSLNIKN